MASNITRDHHNLRRNLNLNGNYISNDGGDEGITVDNDGIVTASSQIDIGNMSLTTSEIDVSSGNFLLDVNGDIKLDADGDTIYLYGSGVTKGNFQLDSHCKLSTPTSTNIELFASSASIILDSQDGQTYIKKNGTQFVTFDTDTSSTFKIIPTVNYDVEFDIIGGSEVRVDSNPTNTADATPTAFHIDYDHTGIVADGETVTGIGLDLDMNCETVTHVGTVNQIGIDLDMLVGTDATQTNLGMDIKCTGGNDNNYGINITIPDVAGDYHLKLMAADDVTDYATIAVAAAGATTLTTVDTTVGATAHLTLDVDGHVAFENCAVGFDKEIAEFSTSPIDSDANDSTDVDFRLGNKFELTLTDDISGSSEFINLIFPAVSGNFILVLIQGVADCIVANAGWIAYQSDGSTKATNSAGNPQAEGRVRWAGGSAPTLSTLQYDVDIISFYWDADDQTAFAVASLDF